MTRFSTNIDGVSVDHTSCWTKLAKLSQEIERLRAEALNAEDLMRQAKDEIDLQRVEIRRLRGELRFSDEERHRALGRSEQAEARLAKVVEALKLIASTHPVWTLEQAHMMKIARAALAVAQPEEPCFCAQGDRDDGTRVLHFHRAGYVVAAAQPEEKP